MNRFGVAKLEQGVREPNWTTVLALAQALGVEVGAFIVSDPRAARASANPSRRKKTVKRNASSRG
jgi:transcriptional regulator with XRE-family HTH domain